MHSQKVFVCDINTAKNRIKTDSKESNAMLAYIFFAHNHYDLAYEYLEKSQTALGMKEGHRQIFHWIQNCTSARSRKFLQRFST
jgi:hypothetical protein